MKKTFLLVSECSQNQYEWETKITENILKDYDKNVLPLKTLNNPVIVKMDLTLYKVISLVNTLNKYFI